MHASAILPHGSAAASEAVPRGRSSGWRHPGKGAPIQPEGRVFVESFAPRRPQSPASLTAAHLKSDSPGRLPVFHNFAFRALSTSTSADPPLDRSRPPRAPTAGLTPLSSWPLASS